MENKLELSLVEEIVSNTKDIAEIENKISVAIADLQQQLEVKKEQEKSLKEALLTAMRESGVKKFQDDLISITYVAPTTRVSVDTTRLKEEKPELYKEYSKTSQVKDSVRIKLN